MKQPVFIRLETSIEKAMSYNNGAQMLEYSFEGVQLRPNNPYPYIQRTYAAGGIAISTFIVRVKSVSCNKELADITDYFSVIQSFNDENTGLNQVYWAITPGQPNDFNNTMVYLEIETGADSFVYSSPFYWTDNNSQFTERIDYRDNEALPMSSIDVVMYYKEPGDEMEVEVYKRVTDGMLRNNFVMITEFEYWQIGVIDVNYYRLIKQALSRRFVFVGLQRTFLKEGFETPRMQADENFGEQEIQLVRDKTKTYNPNEQPFIPVPPVDNPVIVLGRVLYIDDVFVKWYYSIEDFSPEWVLLQVSSDGITFGLFNTAAFTSIESPTSGVPNALEGDYYYRISYPPLGIVSNVVQITNRSLFISGVMRNTATNFTVAWKPVNYTPEGNLRFEYSNDNTLWAIGAYGYITEAYKNIDTEEMSPEAKYFRILDETEELMSNTYELTT